MIRSVFFKEVEDKCGAEVLNEMTFNHKGTVKEWREIIEREYTSAMVLRALFRWKDSPEGYDYWDSMAQKLLVVNTGCDTPDNIDVVVDPIERKDDSEVLRWKQWGGDIESKQAELFKSLKKRANKGGLSEKA